MTDTDTINDLAERAVESARRGTAMHVLPDEYRIIYDADTGTWDSAIYEACRAKGLTAVGLGAVAVVVSRGGQ